MTDEEDEYEMVFEPDEALILALNEINDLKEIVEEQNSSIEELKFGYFFAKSQVFDSLPFSEATSIFLFMNSIEGSFM